MGEDIRKSDEGEQKFPDTWEKAQEITQTTDEARHLERYSLNPDLLALTAEALEYQQAGRNLSLLCRKLSEQEKRPVLVLDNPRTAAFLQTGFQHWLSSFSSIEQGQEFIGELQAGESYAKQWQDLDLAINALRTILQDKKIKYDIRYDKDPSQDIRNELNNNRSFENYHMDIANKKHNIKHGLKGSGLENVGLFNEALVKVYEIKDYLRSRIMAQAGQWLKDGKIDSFVYPINHWKFSGSGEWRPELAMASHKLLQTVEVLETMVVFADVHEIFSKENETTPRPHIIGVQKQYQDHLQGDTYKSWERNGQGAPFAEWLTKQKIIIDTLKYPFAKASKGSGASVQKTVLNHAHVEQPKVIDIHALFPSQDVSIKNMMEK